MDFELTQEQKDIQRAAREFAQAEFTPERGREYDEKEEFLLISGKKPASSAL